MQFNFFRLFFVLSTILFLSSCLDTTTTTTATSSDASFVSMTLAGNDSAKTAVFTLDASGQTIINIDSLPFRTRIDSVYPTFSFKSSAGAKLHYTNPTGYKFKKDSAAVTGKDTVDFRQPGIWIKNYASDAINYKNYNIQVNVHKVHPELYIWSKLKDNVASVSAASQKAILLNDKIYYYLNDGSATYLYTSVDGKSWNQENSLTGLPVNTPLNDMIQFKGNLFLTKDGLNIYTSSNGTTWTKMSVSSFTFNSLLCVWGGDLWAVVQSVSDATYHFATSSDGSVWKMIGTIPNNFPVSDFTATTVTTITGVQKFVVLNGYSSTGSLLKNYWSSEDGLNWYDFSDKSLNYKWTAKNNLDSLEAGASVILYDNKLLLVGKYITRNKTFYRESKDEGLTWQVPDTVYNQIAIGEEFKTSKTYKDTVSYSNYYDPHSYQSVVVNNDNRIFLIGGKVYNAPATVRKYNQGTQNSKSGSGLTPVSDVWTGKLNRKSFLRQ